MKNSKKARKVKREPKHAQQQEVTGDPKQLFDQLAKDPESNNRLIGTLFS